MKTTSKFYTSTCGKSNGNFIENLGFVHTKNIEEADVIIFGGGADIDPALYGEEPGSSTYISKEREKEERSDFTKALQLGIKMIGICRGNQFLCAQAGGKLIQDVSGHGGNHNMTTFDGVTMRVNSIHHQMINPYSIKDKKNYTILGWGTERRSDRYLGARDKSILLPWDFKEIESIYFPKIKGLGFQFHPEMMYDRKEYQPAMDWVIKTCSKFFNNEL